MKSKISKIIIFLIIALTVIMLPKLVKARYDDDRDYRYNYSDEEQEYDDRGFPLNPDRNRNDDDDDEPEYDDRGFLLNPDREHDDNSEDDPDSPDINNRPNRSEQSTIAGADDFINASTGSPLKNGSLASASGTLASTLIIIGIVVAMIVITALGIKFMLGSVEEKAKVKETLIPFTIGCIIIFGAYIIWSLVMQLATTL